MSFIQDLADKFRKQSNKPVMNALGQAGRTYMNVGKTVAQAPRKLASGVSKQFLYDPQKKRPFPQSPLYDLKETADIIADRSIPEDQKQQLVTQKANEMGMLVAGMAEPMRVMSGAVDDLARPTLKTLKELGEGRGNVSKQYLMDLTNRGNIKQAEREAVRNVLDQFPGKKIDADEFGQAVRRQLLPLNTGQRVTQWYESVALPDELRGPVANYKEKVYQSPIETSAGKVHFSGKAVPTEEAINSGKSVGYPTNYFAHSRIEDMADGDTRRVIEIQSDLMQKGRLESEMGNSVVSYADEVKKYLSQAEFDEIKTNPSIKRKEELLRKVADMRNKEVERLQPYRNIWHERLIREEVQDAAQAGKKKLQFPTGETAMKIEGLNRSDMFHNVEPGESGRFRVTSYTQPEDLFVGSQVQGLGSNWVVTDVLEHGKFRARRSVVPVNSYAANVLESNYPALIKDQYGNIDLGQTLSAYKKASEKMYHELLDVIRRSDTVEEFDVSGRADTSDPIYKFYEKPVGKYLQKNYNAKRVTDDQGVSWWEIDVPGKAAREPVEAFNFAPLFPAAGIGAYALERNREKNERI